MANLEESGGANTSAWAEHTIFVISKDGNIDVKDKHGTPGMLTLYGKVENIGTTLLPGERYRVVWEIYNSDGVLVKFYETTGKDTDDDNLQPGDVCPPLTYDIDFKGDPPLALGKYKVRAQAWYYIFPGDTVKEFKFTIKP